MGLKFLKFKGSFNVRAKEKRSTVVCIGYRQTSEFDNYNDVLPSSVTFSDDGYVYRNEQNSYPKPTFQDIFQGVPVASESPKEAVVEVKEEVPVVIANDPPKSILKKSRYENEEESQNMESHNVFEKVTMFSYDQQIERVADEKFEIPKIEITSDEQYEVDDKKETIKMEEQLEVSYDEQVEIKQDALKENYAIQYNDTTEKEETDISDYESEDEYSEEDDQYSSQAASIFFDGLEPPPKMRKKRAQNNTNFDSNEF